MQAVGATKAFRSGTHRTVCPEETLRRLEPRLTEFGVARVADITGLDRVGIPVAQVVRPNARSRIVSAGKGVDRTAAKASAVMEALERFHAERVWAPLRLCSAAELRADEHALELAECPADERVLWAAGFTLSGDRQIWVPFERVHLDQRLPLPDGSGFFVRGSSGLGSGNTFAEAVLHGVCELIEHDATALFRQRTPHDRARRVVAFEGIDDALCIGLMQRFIDAQLQLTIFDATTDVRVPCFVCVVREHDVSGERAVGPVHGAGCHTSRAIALARALCDAAQQRVLRIAGLAAPEPAVLEAVRASGAEIKFRDTPTFEGKTLEEDIAMLRQKLEMASIEVAVVDLSRAKYPLYVVRAVANGLEGDARAAGYRPGARARSVMQEVA